LAIPQFHGLLPVWQSIHSVEFRTGVHELMEWVPLGRRMYRKDRFLSALHFSKKVMLLLVVSCWLILCHTICSMNACWNRKNIQNFGCWGVKICVDPPNHSDWVDEITLKIDDMFLEFIGDPYRKVVPITMTSAIIGANLDRKS
jgi:hypothetical protein